MGKLIFDKRKTYLATINNLTSTRIFQHCYFKDKSGNSIDVAEGGRFSCALLVSGVLYRFYLVSRVRVRVRSLLRDMKYNNWKEIHDVASVPAGAVLVWEPRIAADRESHSHIGFYLGGNRCVSNDPRSPEAGGTLRPIVHNVFMDDILPKKRRIVAAYYHPYLHLGG